MHLEVFLNTTTDNFETWLRWRTAYERMPRYDDWNNFLNFHQAQISHRSDNQLIMMIGASILPYNPTDKVHRLYELSPQIEFEITRVAPSRIKVIASVETRTALPLFLELLGDITQKWPETDATIAAFLADPTATPAVGPKGATSDSEPVGTGNSPNSDLQVDGKQRRRKGQPGRARNTEYDQAHSKMVNEGLTKKEAYKWCVKQFPDWASIQEDSWDSFRKGMALRDGKK